MRNTFQEKKKKKGLSTSLIPGTAAAGGGIHHRLTSQNSNDLLIASCGKHNGLQFKEPSASHKASLHSLTMSFPWAFTQCLGVDLKRRSRGDLRDRHLEMVSISIHPSICHRFACIHTHTYVFYTICIIHTYMISLYDILDYIYI